jgi:hypothetical protein
MSERSKEWAGCVSRGAIVATGSSSDIVDEDDSSFRTSILDFFSRGRDA